MPSGKHQHVAAAKHGLLRQDECGNSVKAVINVIKAL